MAKKVGPPGERAKTKSDESKVTAVQPEPSVESNGDSGKTKRRRSPRNATPADQSEGGKRRRRLGPERLPSDWKAARQLAAKLKAEAEASGELVVDLPPGTLLFAESDSPKRTKRRAGTLLTPDQQRVLRRARELDHKFKRLRVHALRAQRERALRSRKVRTHCCMSKRVRAVQEARRGRDHMNLRQIGKVIRHNLEQLARPVTVAYGPPDLPQPNDNAPRGANYSLTLTERFRRVISEGGSPDHSRYVHPAVNKLRALAVEFVELAKRHANDEAAAVGHILSAVSQAIDDNDLDALNVPKGPHSWARTYLVQHGAVQPDRYIPVETPDGRLLKMAQISGGFHVLADAIERALKSPGRLDSYAPHIAESMAHHFPYLPSLSKEPNKKLRMAAVVTRIRPMLHKLGNDAKKRRLTPETAAPDIARTLLEAEFRMSGMEWDIDRAFGFIDRH